MAVFPVPVVFDPKVLVPTPTISDAVEKIPLCHPIYILSNSVVYSFKIKKIKMYLLHFYFYLFKLIVSSYHLH